MSSILTKSKNILPAQDSILFLLYNQYSRNIIAIGGFEMKCTLRKALHKIMGEDKSYLHYYNSMINAYESGFWGFDIRKLVKNMYFDVPCSYTLSRRGYHKQYCLTVLDFEKFKKQFEKYLNEHIYPKQWLQL
jgi:hypothetical protein